MGCRARLGHRGCVAVMQRDKTVYKLLVLSVLYMLSSSASVHM